MPACLIVDDSSVIRKVARAILEHMGYEVAEADNAKDALARCRVAMPDAIMLDWQMPGINSLDFLTAVRGIRGQKRAFIVYCTTENNFADLTRAYDAGANDFLMKPFDKAMVQEKFALTQLAA
jgi:two-component system, chemotaxis family, chemotaxis protein CheY